MLTTSINFFRSIRDTLFEPIARKVINKYGKGAVFQISTVFGPDYQVACRKVLRNRLSKQLPNHVFRSPLFPKYISNHGQLLSQNVQILI